MRPVKEPEDKDTDTEGSEEAQYVMSSGSQIFFRRTSEGGDEVESDLTTVEVPETSVLRELRRQYLDAAATASSSAAAPAPDAGGAAPPDRERLEKDKVLALFAAHSDWTLEPKDVVFSHRLGCGTSANVYKGEWRGVEVAIKLLKSSGKTAGGHLPDDKTMKEFLYECEVMWTVRHPCVLKFVGSLLQPKICIVVEYCSRGSLFHVLQDSRFDITWTRVLDWLVEISDGIGALHAANPQIYHRDLKTLNILVNRAWHLKVCDFGLARTAGEDYETLGKMRGTFTYLAPELYRGEKYTAASDMYSLSIIMWELITRCIAGQYTKPYVELSKAAAFAVIIKVAKQGLRPTMPETVPRQLKHLLFQTWDSDPVNRPTARSMSAKLRELRREYAANAAEWDAMRNVSFVKEHEAEAEGEADLPDDEPDDDGEVKTASPAPEAKAKAAEPAAAPRSAPEAKDASVAAAAGARPLVSNQKATRHLWKDQSLRQVLTADDVTELRGGGLQVRNAVPMPLSRRPDNVRFKGGSVKLINEQRRTLRANRFEAAVDRLNQAEDAPDLAAIAAGTSDEVAGDALNSSVSGSVGSPRSTSAEIRRRLIDAKKRLTNATNL